MIFIQEKFLYKKYLVIYTYDDTNKILDRLMIKSITFRAKKQSMIPSIEEIRWLRYSEYTIQMISY